MPVLPMLINSQMNKLYFHHFLDHSARTLVAHDCSANPFRTTLPKSGSPKNFRHAHLKDLTSYLLVAMYDSHLLHLLLTYSASHRARYLNHQQPIARIARWTQKIIASLSQARLSPHSWASDTNLAMTLLLTSIELSSPDTCVSGRSWQQHLETAAQMLKSRTKTYPRHLRGSEVDYFLLRWYARIETFGSFCQGTSCAPFAFKYFEDEDGDNNQIDCMLGLSRWSLQHVGNIAELIYKIRKGKALHPEGIAVARILNDYFVASRSQQQTWCPQANCDGRAVSDLNDINNALCGAAHLYMRSQAWCANGLHPSEEALFWDTYTSLIRIKSDRLASNSLVFPMFITGCNLWAMAIDGVKSAILGQLGQLQLSGMAQVR